MRILSPRRPTMLLLAGTIALSVGCSDESGRSNKQDSATSTGAPPIVSDSGTRSEDTSATHQQRDTSPTKPSKPRAATAAAAAKPSTAKRPDSATMAASTDSAAAAPAPATGASQDKSLTYDAAKNTVTFELIAGPFTFNGFSSGGGSLVVPPKANVVINFVNKDGTPHSAEVISGEGPIPNAAADPAIQRAYTNKVSEGLPQEATDDMRFTVPDSGTYRIFCGVPGHGLSGMWIWLKVDPAAKMPSFGPTK
jgi:sulfocyanin SoxE-like protein